MTLIRMVYLPSLETETFLDAGAVLNFPAEVGVAQAVPEGVDHVLVIPLLSPAPGLIVAVAHVDALLVVHEVKRSARSR